MAEPNNNQDLTKIYELIQKNNEQNHQENRWNRITGLIQTFVVLIPSLFLIWKSFKGQKLSPKKRLMKNRAARARLKLNSEAAQARLDLEEKLILEEAFHEAELKNMETGLDSSQGEEKLKQDFLSSLKAKGENLLKDKISQVKEKIGDKDKDKKN